MEPQIASQPLLPTFTERYHTAFQPFLADSIQENPIHCSSGEHCLEKNAEGQ